MTSDKRCSTCLLSRVSYEGRSAGAEPGMIADVEEEAQKIIASLLDHPAWSHPMIASFLHRSVYAMFSCPDPFVQIKASSDAESFAVAMKVKDRLHTFSDFVLASVIANTFDYAVEGHDVTTDFYAFFEENFAKGLDIDHTDEILACSDRIVYFTDNCGEIVFDYLLLQYLKNRGAHLTVVVRDAPILNDATLQEAEALGIADVCDRVIGSGAGTEHGIRFDLLPPVVLDALDNCTLVIAKGMANYESLREFSGLPPIAYLLSAKCLPIAEELHVSRGAKIALLRKKTGF
ncbi:MAG: DUF89 family protein [Methanospirillaceae archaeon]|nr:DUF89 family protein [Methanospirillaceae archaeon]